MAETRDPFDPGAVSPETALFNEQLEAALSAMAPRLLVAVGTEYANDAMPVNSTTEVACFTPVSGG